MPGKLFFDIVRKAFHFNYVVHFKRLVNDGKPVRHQYHQLTGVVTLALAKLVAVRYR